VTGLLLSIPSWGAAEDLSVSVLGNLGEVYSVQAGTYGELFPDGQAAGAEHPILVLDVLRPGSDTERQIVPTTFGLEVESAPRLLYSKLGERLNVVWASRIETETSIFLARFDRDGWSAVEELYFHPGGVVPRPALTTDALHLETGDGEALDLERQTLHLVWPRVEEGEFTVGYMPILFLNGSFIGWKEPFTFRHLDGDANAAATAQLPDTLRVRPHAERDSVSLTFGSTAGGRVTTLEVGLVPMEMVYLSDEIHDLVLQLGFDPEDLASFADQLGVTIVGVGARGRGRSRLTLSLVDYVAAGVRNRVLDTGGSYAADQADLLADDLRAYALELTQSLFSPAVAGARTAKSRPTRDDSKSSSILEIDVSGVFEDDDSAPTSHVLELRSAVEWPLPDSGGAELTLFTSDDGVNLVAAWQDAAARKLWYVESNLDFTWSEPQALDLGERLTLEQAHELLQKRVR
jgi:hypothetical protein